jgi:hypothetical protein
VLRGRVDGVGSDADAERLTHERIRASAGQNGVASTYSMERELPSGRSVNEVEVVASERPREFPIRTTPGRRHSTTATSSLRKTARQSDEARRAGRTAGAAAFLAQLAWRLVKKGANDNLATLKPDPRSVPSLIVEPA